MKVTRAEIEKHLGSLVDTPGQIMQATKSLDEERMQFKADSKSWSVHDILAHLRS